MHIDRLSLLSHLYGIFFNCITACQASWTATTALCMEVGWHCTIAVSACFSAQQLPRHECAMTRSCTPLKRLNGAYINIYGHMQLYIHAFECIHKF